MALLFMEGFEDGLYASRPKVYASAGGSNAAYGRNGSGIRCGDSTNRQYTWLGDNVPAVGSGQKVWASFDVRWVTAGGYGAGPGWFSVAGGSIDGTGRISTLTFDTVNRLFGLAFGSNRYWEPAGANRQSNTWYHITLEILRHASAGSMALYVDGVKVAEATGLALSSAIYFVVPGDGWYNADDLDIDNVVIYDESGTSMNSFQGVMYVDTVRPSGNGSSSGLTGSDADQVDNYALLDETPVDTAQYVEGDTEGEKDTYAMGDIAGTDAVLGVTVLAHCYKTTAGTRFARPVLRSGGVDYAGASSQVQAAWVTMEHMWALDPDGDAAWSVAKVNAMEAGIELRDA